MTKQATEELCHWSSEGLMTEKTRQLQELLVQFTDIFAARDEVEQFNSTLATQLTILTSPQYCIMCPGINQGHTTSPHAWSGAQHPGRPEVTGKAGKDYLFRLWQRLRGCMI